MVFTLVEALHPSGEHSARAGSHPSITSKDELHCVNQKALLGTENHKFALASRLLFSPSLKALKTLEIFPFLLIHAIVCLKILIEHDSVDFQTPI